MSFIDCDCGAIKYRIVSRDRCNPKITLAARLNFKAAFFAVCLSAGLLDASIRLSSELSKLANFRARPRLLVGTLDWVY